MAAVINQNPSVTMTSSLGENARMELAQKIEGQLTGRIAGIHLLEREDGLLVVNEDRTLRVLLRRESGMFWPSIIHDLPHIPTKLSCSEQKNTIFVGFANGQIHEYSIENDFNSISFKRQWNSHTNSISGLGFSERLEQMVSCSKDKTVVWHCTSTTRKIASYCTGSPCTTLQFDGDASFVFVGDYSGNISVLRLVVGTQQQPQLISKLSAHTGAITDLCWDLSHQLLFSASTDSLVIVWDIGGKRGNCYELNGHNAKLTRLALGADSRRLFSADESGKLVCWDMSARRIAAPAWVDSDKCEICDTPFFWNLRVMWDRKIVGVRRHHCRTCGKSVCSNCCGQSSIFPAMGFEKPARICKTCHEKMQNYPEQFDLTPLAVTNELRIGVLEMVLNDRGDKPGRMVTVGYDRTIMMWDVQDLLK
ncbi:hypothetical protein niasHS_003428 [Heterodera schachtii]|uniref:FYVE-type domain-containing protein n=1 Tax=Heterodera schachtii TaxID=97005 RepID=A0ABD2KGX8_HETSC